MSFRAWNDRTSPPQDRVFSGRESRYWLQTKVHAPGVRECNDSNNNAGLSCVDSFGYVLKLPSLRVPA